MKPPPTPNIAYATATTATTSANKTGTSAPPSPWAPSAAAQERVKALLEKRREEARWKDLKSQPGALLIVKTPEGQAQLVRADAVLVTGNVFAAELPGGAKGVWQKELVAERVESGEIEVLALGTPFSSDQKVSNTE